MANTKALESWRSGYAAGKAYAAEYGIATANEHYRYGYCGNGERNYSNGFFRALSDIRAKLEAREAVARKQ